MLKIILLFITFLFTSTTISQVLSGKIIYDVDMDRLQKLNASDNVGNSADALLEQTVELAKEFQLELLFEKNIAHFQHQKALTIDNVEFGDLVKFLISEGEYYTNLKDSIQIMITEFEGKVSNVRSEFKKKQWVLTSDTKKIGDFVCYKATKNQEMFGEIHQVIAWYTPEIPIPLGPKEYVGNLPGLILELDEPRIRFRCSKITLNNKQKVVWPKGIQTISEEQYKKEGEALMQQIKQID